MAATSLIYTWQNPRVDLLFQKGKLYAALTTEGKSHLIAEESLKNLPINNKEFSSQSLELMKEQCKKFQALVSDDKTSIEFKKIEIVSNTSTLKLYIVALSGNNYTICIEPDASIMDVKYLVNERSGIAIEDIVLKFGSTLLENKRTLTHYGIKDNATLRHTAYLRGGGIGEICDFNNLEKIVHWDLTKDGHDYQKIKAGLNLQGVCHTITCEAYLDTIFIQVGLGVFSLSEEIHKAKCPSCKKEVPDETIKNVGFWNCYFEMEGKKLEINGVPVPEDKRIVKEDRRRAEKKHYTTFDPQDGGVKWGYIKFTVTQLI